MSKKKSGGKPAPQRAGQPARASQSSASQSNRTWSLAQACLMIAMLSSAMLVSKHFSGHDLPGCGPTSACAQLEATVWGKVPGLGWPTSFVGLAWFVGLLAAWWSARITISPLLVTLARVGAAASLMFVIVMLVKQKLCPYCLTAHIANLGFWALVERARGSAFPSSADLPVAARRALLGMGLGFVVMTLGLAPAEINHRAKKRGDAEAAATASMKAINEKSGTSSETSTGQTSTGQTSANESNAAAQPASTAPTTDKQTVDLETGKGTETAATAPPAGTPPANTTPATTTPASTTPAANTPAQPRGFTGRYRLGPEKAAYRIVMFTDFQCKDCKRVEGEVLEVMAQRKDISLSVKNFPMCNLCNEKMGKLNLHPNACWAARAAEAAGMLKGSDGYFAMFRWLFDRTGSFTDAEIKAVLPTMGYDANTFLATMQSTPTEVLVKQDIEEAANLGIQYTPLMFINGVEFRGWEVPGVVKKALTELDGKAPALTAENDKPAPAIEKYIDDWRAQGARRAPVDPHPHWISGTPEAKVQVLVFGDYDDENTAKLDFAVRQLVHGRSDYAYSFRHYPASNECNPKLTKAFTEQGCAAARACEAAGIVGGEAAYGKMHEWLLSREGSLSPDFVTKAATSLGLDAAKLGTTMNDPAVAAAINEDIAAAGTMGVIQIPQVYVNGKWLPRWMKEGDDVLGRVLTEASK